MKTMKTLCVAIATIFYFAVAAASVIGVAASARADGPVREGLRRTGELAVDGTRTVVQGGARVVERTGLAAGNIVEGTVQGTRNLGRAVVGAPPVGNGQYSDGRYAAGYRGVEPGVVPQSVPEGAQASGAVDSPQRSAWHQGPVYPLRRDSQGREFICDHGRRLYVKGPVAPDEAGQIGERPEAPNESQWNQSQAQPATPTPTYENSNAGAAAEAAAPREENQQVEPGQPAPPQPNNGSANP